MSGPDFPWEQIPDAAMEAFDERLRLVEMLLDPHIGNADKRAERRRYCEQHRVGGRTIRGYLHRYRKKGPRGLLFYRPRPTSPRVHDPGLRAKLLALVNELPTRSIPQLRKLLATDDQLGSKINRNCHLPLPWPSSRSPHLRSHHLPWPSRASPRRSATACSLKTRAAPTARSRHRTPWPSCRPTPATASGSTPPKAARKPTCSSGSTTSPAKSCSASTISTRSCPP